MKSLFFVFMSFYFFSNASQACPDLTGSYLCKQNSYRKDSLYSFTRAQNTKGDWTFTMAVNPPGGIVISYFSFIADGVERDVVDAITAQELRLSASCKDNKLIVSGQTKASASPIRFYEELSLTADGDLSNISLDINGNTVSEICARSSSRSQ